MTVDQEALASITPLHLGPLAERPLVSVLIANYNYGMYLGQAIDSVLAQSYGYFEIIVCDDGSTDGSVDVANTRAQRDARVTLLRQENAGQARAMCSAYGRSSGEIICFLDADDEYLPDKLKQVVDAYLAHPEVGFVTDRVIRVDARGKQRGIIPLLAPAGVDWCAPMLLQTGVLRDLPPCSGLSLRRDIADEIFPLYEPASVHGHFADRIIQRVAPLITPVLRLRQPLTKYRLHSANVSACSMTMTPRMLECQLVHDKIAAGVQRSYLASRYPALSHVLVPVESELTSRFLYYIRARLTGASDIQQAYRHLVHHPAFGQEPWFLQWFWKASILFPGPVFRRAADVVMGANFIKYVAARFIR